MILAAFRVRSFRFQWSADLLTSWAFEMETLILGWYVMVNTGSVLLLTVFGSLQFLGTLAAPMFGVLGDRLGGRAMLCAMRAIYAALAALLMLPGPDRPADAGVGVRVADARRHRPPQRPRDAQLADRRDDPAGPLWARSACRAPPWTPRAWAARWPAPGCPPRSASASPTSFVTVFYVASLALTFGVARRRPVPDPGARGDAAGASLPGPSGWRDLKDGLLTS